MSELEAIGKGLYSFILQPNVLTVFVIVFATMVIHYLARRLVVLLEKGAKRTATFWDDALARSARRPLGWLVWLVGISLAADYLAAGTESTLAELIQPTRFVLVVGLLVYFTVVFVKEAERLLVAKGSDVTTANAVGKLLRASVIITGMLSVLQTLGISISGILAFGGVGGIAIGFAAKDLLANFFGSIMIYLDRPFVVGDWIRSPDRSIEGTVEKIGWRLTVIRTFDQRPLYVPNAVFSTVSIENPSRMRNRRIYETIGLRYEDAGKMEAIVAQVRQMLANHPDIDANRTLIVNMNSFAASALEFFVYTFTKTTNWVEYHQVKERILLEIVKIVHAEGADFAFPTQTVHLAEPPLDE